MGYIDRGDDGPPDQEGFPDHFEWDGTGWRYFRDGWKAPVPLSDDEYHRAISWYENGLFAVIAGCALLGVSMFFLPTRWFEALSEGGRAMGATVIILLAGFAGFRAQNWLATRSFRNRTPVGSPRDPQALKRQRLASTSWLNLVANIVTSAAFTALWLFDKRGYFWVAWVCLLLFSVYRAYQKWNLKRHPFRPTSP